MGASLTSIDRHSGHLARDGHEHADPPARRAEGRTTSTVDAGGRWVDANAPRPQPGEATKEPAKQAKSRSPLTDSNRRPPLYEEGPCVKSSVVGIAQSGRALLWWVASRAHLSIASSTGRTRPIGVRSGGASP